MGMPPLRVLCVDDEPDMLAVVRIALELSGNVVVRTCNSGAAATAQASAFRPDIVLLDVMMPEMDGPATLAALRRTKEAEKMPVAFFTAKAEPSEISRLRALGAADVIVKPFDPLKLEQRIREILASPAANDF